MRNRITRSPLKWRNIAVVGVLLDIFALFIYTFCLSPGSLSHTVTGKLILIITCAVFLSCPFFWRCPACHRTLPLDHIMSIKFCPFCNENL